jgi:hypothetical protein
MQMIFRVKTESWRIDRVHEDGCCRKIKLHDSMNLALNAIQVYPKKPPVFMRQHLMKCPSITRSSTDPFRVFLPHLPQARKPV